jgi:hypothetical protein
MRLLENYRSSTDQKEILRILQKSSTSSENFLWQPIGDQKNVIPIHHYEIDFVSREVVVYFDRSMYSYVSEAPLYVKLDYRTSIFKVLEVRKTIDSLSFSFPRGMKTLELRGIPRHVFSSDEEKTVGLRPTLNRGDEGGQELYVRLRDISSFGLGLIVSEQNRYFLKNNRILWVTKVGEDQLATPILAEIQYVNQDQENIRQQKKRQKELKVGLKLSGFIPDSILEKIIQ